MLAIWVFDFSQLPLNGRVWYPEGDSHRFCHLEARAAAAARWGNVAREPGSALHLGGGCCARVQPGTAAGNDAGVGAHRTDQITAIRFIFAGERGGAVYLDEIGFMDPVD